MSSHHPEMTDSQPASTPASAPAIFHPDGDLFAPTHLAQGPWFPNAQHGGAIVGLSAHLAEQMPSAVPMQPVRITTELFRQVPMEPVAPEVEVVREGRRIQLLAVSLWDRGQTVELSRSHVLRIRIAPGEVADELVPDRPEAERVPEFLDEQARVNTDTLLSHMKVDQPSFPAAFELRSRREYGSPHSVSWWRLQAPLVAGCELTSFVRLAATADYLMSAGGIVGATEHVSINPDLTVYAHKLSDDPWVGVESKVHFDTDGLGITAGNLYDRASHIGTATKSLLIFRR